jgi:GNAT superfamily N-acetyltransferase
MLAVYRALEADEIPLAAELFVSTLADLARRHGLPEPAWSAASAEPTFHHLHATGEFQVAEQDGRIVSICAAVVREQAWFLSMFWTAPGLQRQGVGRPLLRRVWEAGRARGARRSFTWSSIDPGAVSVYLRLGMLPGCQIFNFAGPLRSPPPPPAGLELAPLTLEVARTVDERIWGGTRDEDHRFWLASGGSAWEVRRGARLAGYLYCRGGAIGPAAWLEPQDGPELLALALHHAGAQGPEVRMAAVGVNHDALRAALGAGLRLVGTPHLLTSEPFGTLSQYLPSGPALF